MRGEASHFLLLFLAFEDMGVLVSLFHRARWTMVEEVLVWMTWLIKKQTAY